jgi:hypothetical protein
VKNFLLFALLCAFGVSGCATTEETEEGKVYYDPAMIVRKQGHNTCRMVFVTDRYGFFNSHILPLEICEYYREGDRVRVKIENGWATPLDHIEK